MEPVTPKAIASPAQELHEAVQRVEALGPEPIAEHVSAFENVHRVLQEHLSEAEDG